MNNLKARKFPKKFTPEASIMKDVESSLSLLIRKNLDNFSLVEN